MKWLAKLFAVVESLRACLANLRAALESLGPEADGAREQLKSLLPLADQLHELHGDASSELSPPEGDQESMRF